MSIRTLIGSALVACCTLVMTTAVRADAPPYIPIQGYLANAAGTPVNGAVAIRFRLYDAATAGTVLFEESKAVVNVEAGYFTVYLGEESSIDLGVFSEHPIVFVGVLVSGDTLELSPRLQLATAPYAAFAQSCGDASTVGGLTADELKVQGPVGPAGPKGDTGSTGPKGDTGSPGVLMVSPTAPITASLSNQTLNLGFSALSCSAGNSIRAISATGVVTCEPDDDTIIAQSTIEGYARSVCYDQESELTAALNDNYFARSGGTVSGAVAATDFTYTTPVTRTLWVGALGMEQNAPGPFIANSSAGGATFSAAPAGGYYFVDDLRLPNGATITGYYCEYLDNSANANFATVSTQIDVRSLGTRTVVSAFSASNTGTTGASTSVQRIQAAPTANSPGGTFTLNDSAASLVIGVSIDATPSTGSGMVVYGCLISYTVPRPE